MSLKEAVLNYTASNISVAFIPANISASLKLPARQIAQQEILEK